MSATMRCWQDLPPRPAWNEERHVRAMLASDTWATEFAAGMAEARAQGIRLVSHCVFDGRCEVFGTMTVAYFEILQKVLPIAIRGRVGRRMRCRRLRQADPAVPMAVPGTESPEKLLLASSSRALVCFCLLLFSGLLSGAVTGLLPLLDLHSRQGGEIKRAGVHGANDVGRDVGSGIGRQQSLL